MWHKETSGFHLPIGEVTITLDDVASLLHLPITGAFHSFETLHVDKVVLLLVELLEVSADEAGAEIVQCHGGICTTITCMWSSWTPFETSLGVEAMHGELPP